MKASRMPCVSLVGASLGWHPSDIYLTVSLLPSRLADANSPPDRYIGTCPGNMNASWEALREPNESLVRFDIHQNPWGGRGGELLQKVYLKIYLCQLYDAKSKPLTQAKQRSFDIFICFAKAFQSDLILIKSHFRCYHVTWITRLSEPLVTRTLATWENRKKNHREKKEKFFIQRCSILPGNNAA